MERIKTEMEFVINVPSDLLLSYITNPNNLELWFCDKVVEASDSYVFIWDGSEEKAKIVKNNNFDVIQFKFENDDSDNPYSFEFRIDEDELTGDISLVVTDYIEKDDIEDIKSLWEKQISKLSVLLGIKEI